MKGKSLALFLSVLYGSAFIAGFNENLVNMALVSIMGEYSIDSVTAQWLVTGYMIVATVMVMCMAFLYRRFKLRSLYFAATAFTLVGMGLGLVAPNYLVLLISRLIAAVGSGIFIPLMMNTILVITPKNKLGTYLSIGGCMITFGPALAPVVCGALVTAFGWHSIFVVPIVAMIILLAMAIPGTSNLENDQTARLDAPSVALATVALSALSIGLAEITLIPALAAGLLVLAAVTAVAFVLRQLHCAHPLIDLTPMKSRAFWPSVLLTTVAMMGSFSCNVLLPLYFEGAGGLTAFIAGMIILVPVLGNAGCTLLGGRIMDKRGEWPLLPAGYATIAIGFALMVALGPTLSIPAMFGAALVVYVGTGFIFSPSQTAGLRTLPPEQNPHGVALSTTFVQIAACIGPALYTGILASGQSAAMAAGSSANDALALGFSYAMIVATIIAAAGCALALVYSRAAVKRDAAARRKRTHAHTQSANVLADLMKHDPFVLPENAPVRDAMAQLIEHRVGGLPIVDRSGKPVGFLTDGDIMRYLADQHPTITTLYSLVEVANNQSFDDRLRELINLPVSAIAADSVVTIEETSTLEEACNLLSTHKFKKLPVVRGSKIVGTINRSDIIRFAMERSLSVQ